VSLYRLAARLAVALALGGSGTLRWVDRTPNVYEDVLAAIAVIVALIMLASIAAHFRLPVLLVELAAAAGVVVLVTDGAESLLSQEQRGASILRTVLFTLAGAVVALAVMLDQSRRRRRRGVTL
jgi:hypothetical protein